MMMNVFTDYALLVAALFGLCAMLRWDLQMMQQHGYSNSRYFAWLRQSGEPTSLKRILILAVLAGTFTTMALVSWMVMAALAGVLAIFGFVMFFRRQDRPLVMSGRAVRLYIFSLILAVIAVVAVFIIYDRLDMKDSAHTAATVAVILLAVSPLLIMLANALLHPFEGHPDYSQINKKSKS